MSLDRAALHVGFACLLILTAPLAVSAPLPFLVSGPDLPTPAQIMDSVSNTCADYNAHVSTVGVAALGGTNVPGSCGFSTFQISLNGQPAAQFLAVLATGANPLPFRVVFTESPPGYCALASSVRVQLGAIVQSNLSSWPKAAAIGGACGAESARHPLIDGALSAHAFARLRVVGDILDRAVSGANAVQVCVAKNAPHSKQILWQKLAATFAAKVQTALMSRAVRLIQANWDQTAVITANCLLRCNQCGSGWAGTITNNQVVQDSANPHQFLANEADTYFVGGAPLVMGNTAQYPSDWTSTGGGFNIISNGNKKWTLNAAASGDCSNLHSSQHVCVQVLTDMAREVLVFTEISEPLSIDNGYQLTQNGGPVMYSAAGENQFSGVISIGAAATDTSAAGHQVVQPASVLACTLPPLHSGTLTCTQTWDWKLYLQQ